MLAGGTRWLVDRTVLGAGLTQIYGPPSVPMQLYDFVSPVRVVMAVCAWVVLVDLFRDPWPRGKTGRGAVRFWANTTLGLYLIHPMFRELWWAGMAAGQPAAADPRRGRCDPLRPRADERAVGRAGRGRTRLRAVAGRDGGADADSGRSPNNGVASAVWDRSAAASDERGASAGVSPVVPRQVRRLAGTAAAVGLLAVVGSAWGRSGGPARDLGQTGHPAGGRRARGRRRLTSWRPCRCRRPPATTSCGSARTWTGQPGRDELPAAPAPRVHAGRASRPDAGVPARVGRVGQRPGRGVHARPHGPPAARRDRPGPGRDLPAGGAGPAVPAAGAAVGHAVHDRRRERAGGEHAAAGPSGPRPGVPDRAEHGRAGHLVRGRGGPGPVRGRGPVHGHAVAPGRGRAGAAGRAGVVLGGAGRRTPSSSPAPGRWRRPWPGPRSSGGSSTCWATATTRSTPRTSTRRSTSGC